MLAEDQDPETGRILAKNAYDDLATRYRDGWTLMSAQTVLRLLGDKEAAKAVCVELKNHPEWFPVLRPATKQFLDYNAGNLTADRSGHSSGAGRPEGTAAVPERTARAANRARGTQLAPAVAGRGVGAMLCEALEKLAAGRGAPSLTADASDNALSFFTHRGFVAERRNTVPRNGEWIANTTVKKQLSAAKESFQ